MKWSLMYAGAVRRQPHDGADVMLSLSGLLYYQVDVFSAQALAGNGLTVFLPESALAPALMLQLSREMRQFESIFVAPTARAGVFDARIFTMEEELAFAGHPVLGAAGLLHHVYAALDDGATWQLMLGDRALPVVTRRVGAARYGSSMNQGVASFGAPLERAQSAVFLAALNLSEQQCDPRYPLQVVSTGLPYLLVPVVHGLERARIAHGAFEALLATVGAKFVYVLDVAAREGRTWDNAGMVEDIATGSGAGGPGDYAAAGALCGASEPDDGVRPRARRRDTGQRRRERVGAGPVSLSAAGPAMCATVGDGVCWAAINLIKWCNTDIFF